MEKDRDERKYRREGAHPVEGKEAGVESLGAFPKSKKRVNVYFIFTTCAFMF